MRISALFAIRFRQALQYLDQLGAFGSVGAWFDVVAVIPGIVDFPFDPLDDLAALVLVLNCVDRDRAFRDRNQPAFVPKGDRWRVGSELVAFDDRIQVGNGATHVLVQPGDAVDALGGRHAVVVDDVELVALQQHGSTVPLK